MKAVAAFKTYIGLGGTTQELATAYTAELLVFKKAAGQDILNHVAKAPRSGS